MGKGGETTGATLAETAHRARTWEVVEEGDGGGAADDCVGPEPPPGSEDGAGDARAHDGPRRQKVVVIHRLAVAASDSDAGKGKPETERRAALFSLVLVVTFSIVILAKEFLDCSFTTHE